MSKLTIDMPTGFKEIEDVFELSSFLDNTNELIEDFKPEVLKYLVKETFFTGPFKLEYNKMFDELIQQLIRNKLRDHFPNINPEEFLLLTDLPLLKMLGEPLFNKESYKTTDKKLN